tara:strand:+ start:1384 stop:1998 length:615 start_codon:yes stop_codon:yes gene_type:complete
MGLKDLKSKLDLTGGYGDNNSPVGDMKDFTPETFDNGRDSTLHQDSLLTQYNYSHGEALGTGGPVPNNSQYQDLDGLPGPKFQQEKDIASQVHESSLSSIPPPSEYQDLDGNVESPNKFQLPKEAASQVHIDSLQKVPGGDQNSRFQDLDGLPGPQFQQEKDIASQVHISSLSLVPGGTQNSPYQDLDGQTPSGYTNPDNGNTF